MSEPRKNHLSIDGGQVKEDENIDSYKPIPDSDTGFRQSKSNLGKSKEKVSTDEAEEKLLEKEDEAKITTRVDMADAKYVVGDHRNGDAKIELDANKRQFTGLTKEELMKYADDPFWVRLRWFMFVLFWALWVAMLAGAIAIIVRAPKCAAPPPKTWYEVGPLVDMTSMDYPEFEQELPKLTRAGVQAVFVDGCEIAYDVLEEPQPSCFETFKKYVKAAKDAGIRVIVELTANHVTNLHPWFLKSANYTQEKANNENTSIAYKDYFVWGKGKDFTADGKPALPNTWAAINDESMWAYNEVRQEYYLNHLGSDKPDLNFHNDVVVNLFADTLKKWMGAGAAGVRLSHARHLVVNASLPSEPPAPASRARGAVHTDYAFFHHKQTSDQDKLNDIFSFWSAVVANGSSEETVFTIKEDGLLKPEWHRLAERRIDSLRPPSTVPVSVTDINATAVDLQLLTAGGSWPAIQLITSEPGDDEIARFAMLLPAAPVLSPAQVINDTNDVNVKASSRFSHAVALRSDASIEFGRGNVTVVPAVGGQDRVLVCYRFKPGHTGYAAVYNPADSDARANLTELPSLPDAITIHHVSPQVHSLTNYTSNAEVPSGDVLVPPRSTVVLSYVPKTTIEK